MRFEDVYRRKLWATAGVLSGDGSRVETASHVAEWLDQQADDGMQSVLDLGCGDLEWLSRCDSITSRRMTYKGVDVVEPLIEHHRRIFPWFVGMARDLEEFGKFSSDVILLKDVIFHHCNGTAGQILMAVNAGTWKRFLVSTHPGANNSKRRGLRRGDMQPLDVEATGLIQGSPSYYLPRPGGVYAVFERP